MPPSPSSRNGQHKKTIRKRSRSPPPPPPSSTLTSNRNYDRRSSRTYPRRSSPVDGHRSEPRKIESKPWFIAKVTIEHSPLPEESKEGNGEEWVDPDFVLKSMGIGGFDSTKGKHVPGADASAVNIKKKRIYRQYMNKKRGLSNRPPPPPTAEGQ